MRNLFTLIELIVVIAVLGILAAIIIPNISSFQEEADETAILSNVRNLQTSVDMYGLDYFGSVPTVDIPKEDVPQPIDFNKIYPDYTRDMPETEGVKYWVDFQGKVWASTIDSPTNISYNPGTLEWAGVQDAAYYNIFKVVDNSATSSIKNKKTIFIKKLEDSSETVTDNTLPNLKTGEQYLVSAIDDNGFESAPAGTDYTGYVEPVFNGGNQNNDSLVPVGQEESKTYTGNFETWIVPETGKYKLEVWGASGGNSKHTSSNTEAYGGKGGYAYGEIDLTQGQELYIYIGGRGQDALDGGVGGFNGGGNGSAKPTGSTGYGGGGGGGATDIRIDGQTLNNRILVAAGGGGAYGESANSGTAPSNGGDGGGLTGEHEMIHGYDHTMNGHGGTQSSAGAGGAQIDAGKEAGFGFGGQGDNNDAGGGGSGWYGGGGGGNNGSGGGGSSYVGSLSNSGTTYGVNDGNGKVKITRIQ